MRGLLFVTALVCLGGMDLRGVFFCNRVTVYFYMQFKIYLEASFFTPEFLKSY
jgi:hypothetical protein